MLLTSNKNNLSKYPSFSTFSNTDINHSEKYNCNLACKRIDVSGTWITGWKGAPVKMYLFQEGNLVTGTYEFNDGKVVGVLNGNILEGGWVELDNVGNFRFAFFDNGTRFEGNWGYGKDSTGAGIWYGRKFQEESFDITGVWDSNYSRMYLEQRDNTVVGKYDKNNGRMEGVLEGNILTGNWFESRFKIGSFDTTGRFRLTFNTPNTFTGSRGVKDSINNEGPWTGKKVGSLSSLAIEEITIDTTGTWNTNFNTMYLRQTGFNVSGEFEFNNGKILGVIYGDTMTGNWYQDIDKDGIYNTIGTFIFVFSRDNTSFKGTWGYGDSPSNGGLWNGVRVA